MKFLKNYEIQHLDQNYDFLVRHLQDATQNNELQITKDGLDNLINVLKHNIVLEDDVRKIKDAARATYFGDIRNWNDPYIRFNAYGNLETTYRIDYEPYDEEILEAWLTQTFE